MAVPKGKTGGLNGARLGDDCPICGAKVEELEGLDAAQSIKSFPPKPDPRPEVYRSVVCSGPMAHRLVNLDALPPPTRGVLAQP